MGGKDEFNRLLGGRIREARERAAIRQDQLAAAVGLSRTSITNIEQGRQGVQAYLLVQLAGVLGCSPLQLLPSSLASPAPASVPQKVKRLDRAGREWAQKILGAPTATQDDGDHAT